MLVGRFSSELMQLSTWSLFKIYRRISQEDKSSKGNKVFLMYYVLPEQSFYMILIRRPPWFKKCGISTFHLWLAVSNQRFQTNTHIMIKIGQIDRKVVPQSFLDISTHNISTYYWLLDGKLDTGEFKCISSRGFNNPKCKKVVWILNSTFCNIARWYHQVEAVPAHYTAIYMKQVNVRDYADLKRINMSTNISIHFVCDVYLYCNY